jgi:signal transduction histidine kinase
LRVRQKLVLLVVPLLLLAVAGAVPLVVSRVQAAERSSDSAKLVQRAVRITELVQELQQERLASLGYLSNDVAREDVVARSTRVLELARQIGADYGDGDDKLALQLRQVTLRSGLDGLRPQILEQRIAGIGVYTGFTGSIEGLIDQLRLTDDADLRADAGRQQVALDAIIRHDEATAAEGAALFIEPGRRITMRVVGLVGGGLALEDREESVFKQLADPSSADLYERVEASRSSTRLNNYLDGIVGSNATQISATIAGDLAPQVQSLTSLSRLVETRVAAQAVAEADRSARTDRWLAGIVGGVALVLLIGAALLSVLIARSIARPLRRLTASADEVADVAQLELVRVADTDDPEAAVPQLRPVRVGTSDELGELAQAFNRVQQVASSLVERQLVSRQNVATMFGNVGRRTQNLVGRQLAMIDSLERNEQDPALLDRLYRLDHVSTRLRRNANSLVVLSGATEQQITSEPLSVADTIRSALGEIEGFQRVRLGSVDETLLTPTVTADVILLLAELLENGTSFSPPHTEVEVEARSGDEGGVLIRVVDHGLGMTPEQLEAENARLVSRERLDLAPTDVLGLFVVGRLARRHGIDVRLLPTPGTGVTAEVRIPDQHVVRSDQPAPAAAPAPASAPAVPAAPAVTPAAPAAPAPDERGWWDSPSPAVDRATAAPSRPAAPASGPSAPTAFRAGPGIPSRGVDAPGNGAVPGAAAELAAAAEAARTAGTDVPGPAPDVPRPRGAAGMVRRIRGAQHPDTGERDQQPEAFRPPSADDARQEIEDFEAGVRRALRETGGDGGSGFVVEDGVAPWTDLDPDNPEGAEQTRALVEEFEDGVRRALARLDQVAGRAAEPVTLFERRRATAPRPPANGAEPPVAPLRANGADPPAAPPSAPHEPTSGTESPAGPPAAPHRPAKGAEPPAGPPRRLDAGTGARRATDDRAAHADPRPLERRRPPEPAQFRTPAPPFPPAQPPFPPAAQAPFRVPAPVADPTPPAGPAVTPPADGGTADAAVSEGAAAQDTVEPDRTQDAAAASSEVTGAPAAEVAAGERDAGEAEAAEDRAAEDRAAEDRAAEDRAAEDRAAEDRAETDAGAVDDTAVAAGAAADPEVGDAAGKDAEAEAASDTESSGATPAPEAAAGPEDSAETAAEAAVGGSSGSDNGVVGAGTGEPVAGGEHEGSRGNGAGPNGRVANGSDGGKMDTSGGGLVRRVPGAQMPAGALAARPGMPTAAPPDTAEQDAAAARSLVEEFEAGVQRALRDAPSTPGTDEDGVR